MSVDLLSEFDSFYQGPRQATGSTAPPQPSSSRQSFFDDLLSLDSQAASNATPNLAINSSNSISTGFPPITQNSSLLEQNAGQATGGGQWGSFDLLSAELQPVTRGDISSHDNDGEADQWGDFESFETATAEPVPPTVPGVVQSSSAHPFVSPTKATIQSLDYGKTSEPGQGDSYAAKPSPYSGPRPGTTPPKSDYASFMTHMQSHSNRQRSSSLRNQIFPDPQGRIAAPSNELLFDAVEEMSGKDDEFGDFESGSVPKDSIVSPQDPPKPRPSKGFKGAPLTLEDTPLSPPSSLSPLPSPYPQAPKSPSFQERNPFAGISVAISPGLVSEHPKSESPVTAWPSFVPPKPAPYQDSPVGGNVQDEKWSNFLDSPTFEDVAGPSARRDSAAGWNFPIIEKADILQPTQSFSPARPLSDSEQVGPHVNVQDPSSSPSTPFPSTITSLPKKALADPTLSSSRPSNVPPPSILLPLFPPLFNLPNSSLFNQISSRSASLKSRVLSHPSTATFLKAYLALATVAARIIAGRKVRWKRDSGLAQGTKISQAGIGSRGGMKLTGVNRAELQKEEREVAEVVQAWKDQLGPLKSGVAAVNIPEPGALGQIPEIVEAMRVKTVTELEGGVKAPQCCALCGMGRDERVVGVDGEVEDSFGEFWVEYWGHRGCRNFWEEYKGKLAQR